MEIQELLDALYPDDFSENRKDKVLEILEQHVNWNSRHRVHDWKNYVPDSITAIWTELSINEKILIYYYSKKQADDEEWN